MKKKVQFFPGWLAFIALIPAAQSLLALGLQENVFSVNTYTADRFATVQGTDGSGSYTYSLPAGAGDNTLFSIESETGVLSLPHPILETGIIKNITVRVTDKADGAISDVPVTVNVTGTIRKWNVSTLSTNPGGLPDWIAGEDNSNAMDRLQERMLEEQEVDWDVAFEITIPSGQYDHQRPDFLAGIRRVRLIGAGKDEGSGTRLRNTRRSASWYESVHLTTNGDYYMRTEANCFACEHFGFRIQTAARGATQVTLLEPVDNERLSGLQIGRRVWITSGITSLYPAYPPHLRYFESARITGFTGQGSGAVINLDRPLRYEHRSDGPEVASALALGRARIVFGDPDYNPGTEVVVLEGIRFLPNPNWGTSSPQYDSDQVQVFGAQYACLKDLYMTSWGPQLSTLQVLRNVDVVGSSEPDAQIGKILIEDSRIGDIFGPNGSTTVTARRTTFTGAIKFGMDKFIADNCDFTKWQADAGGYWVLFTLDHLGPTSEVRITNSRFWRTGSGDKPIFGGTSWCDYTVGSQVQYNQDPPAFTAADPGGNAFDTPFDVLSTWLGEGTGRVMYRQEEQTRWGTVSSITVPGGPGTAVRAEVEWDAGGGSGISNGTTVRFFKIRDLVLQNVSMIGWTDEGQLVNAHGVANHQFYLEQGLAVPDSIWDVEFMPEGAVTGARDNLKGTRENGLKLSASQDFLNGTITFICNVTGKTGAVLSIFNSTGQLMFFHPNVPAGPSKVVWNGKQKTNGLASSGIYLAQLRKGRQSVTRRITARPRFPRYPITQRY
jgi:hypothetical protein